MFQSTREATGLQTAPPWDLHPDPGSWSALQGAGQRQMFPALLLSHEQTEERE